MLAVLEHAFGTCAILLAVPRRWWVRTAVRIAQDIHSSVSGKDGSPAESLPETGLFPVPSSRRALSQRVARLPAARRLPVFKRLCLDLAYLCADTKKSTRGSGVEDYGEGAGFD